MAEGGAGAVAMRGWDRDGGFIRNESGGCTRRVWIWEVGWGWGQLGNRTEKVGTWGVGDRSEETVNARVRCPAWRARKPRLLERVLPAEQRLGLGL